MGVLPASLGLVKNRKVFEKAVEFCPLFLGPPAGPAPPRGGVTRLWVGGSRPNLPAGFKKKSEFRVCSAHRGSLSAVARADQAVYCVVGCGGRSFMLYGFCTKRIAWPPRAQ